MGSGTSRPQQLASNEQLQRFVSPEALSPGHPFWNGMLSFQMKTPRTKKDWKALEETLEELLKRFSSNNLKSGNFGSLVQIFLSRQAELKSSLETDSSLFVWQTFNALFILRVCTKFFVERLKEDEVFRQFCAQPSLVGSKSNNLADGENGEVGKASTETVQIDPGKRFEAFIESLVDIEVELPNSELTYGLHCECVITLLILLSTPLFTLSPPAFQMRAFRAIFSSDKADAFTAALVTNYGLQSVAPPQYLSEEGGSVVLGIASGVWNILTLGYGSVATAATSAATDDDHPPSNKPLADASLLLLLVLNNHCTDTASVSNPYRHILFNCTNVTSGGDDSDGSVSSFRTDFGRLFKTICDTLEGDGPTLLLYLLLHKNTSFRTHVLASSDIERVVVPILKTLYNAPDSSNHHIYMSLIVLLILSEDDLFNTSVHDIMLKNVDWYTERALQEVSLGGLLILVVIRTIQYNMLKMRDKYLHTNCLAALANMSSQFKNLHPYVCQRIVSMFETLAKKHSRLVSTLHHSEGVDGLEEDSMINEALADVAVLEEVLRMILEIINSALVSQIKSNSNLIYTLLYKKELFEPFITHPSFQDLSQNLQTVITYFNSKLEQIQEKKERTLGVNEVQDVIRQTAMQFPREKLTKFPDLKFKYVEEEQPEDFFLPYVWTLVTQKVYFNPANIKLLGQD